MISQNNKTWWQRFRSRWLWATPRDLEEMGSRIMSKQSDVAGIVTDANTKLTAALAKLNAIDTAVKALVAASTSTDADLDPTTQAALDNLVSTVGSVGTEVDTVAADSTVPVTIVPTPADPTANGGLAAN